jgi:hypothetical protein
MSVANGPPLHDQGILTGIGIVSSSNATDPEAVFAVQSDCLFVCHANFEEVVKNSSFLTRVQKVVDQLGSQPHATEGRMYGEIQDVTLIQGQPRAKITENERGIQLTKYKGKGMPRTQLCLKGPATPRDRIRCPLDGEDLFEILLAHPSYREKHEGFPELST